MTDEIKISAKDLGAMALDSFCPRCFWLKRKAKQLPFQIFPGIFSSIDAYTKRVMHAYIDQYGMAPAWYPENDKVCGYDKAPHWSKYWYRDPATGITISGVVDDLLVCIDKTHSIPDYKTAKYTANQDKLLPMYRVQLNAYAIINEHTLGVEVSSMPLVYCEPVTDESACTQRVFQANGFDMGFAVKILHVERDEKMVFDLLDKAKGIIESPIPDSAEGCKDCAKLEIIINLVGNNGSEKF